MMRASADVLLQLILCYWYPCDAMMMTHIRLIAAFCPGYNNFAQFSGVSSQQLANSHLHGVIDDIKLGF